MSAVFEAGRAGDVLGTGAAEDTTTDDDGAAVDDGDGAAGGNVGAAEGGAGWFGITDVEDGAV